MTFPVTVRVKFADGSEVREQWDGQYRWQKFKYTNKPKIVSAELDPDHAWKLEVLRANNSALKDAVELADGKAATLRYALPADADYVFFQPDEGDRFVKFEGGFADTSALLPGEQSNPFAVQYMVPYTQQRDYDYTAPVNIKAMNFLVPENSGVQLKGNGITGPETMTSGAGKTYELYSAAGLSAG